LIQPLSFLASRDAGAVRRRLEQVAVLEEVWLAGDRLFGAAVDVCAPVVRVGDPFHRCQVEAPVVVCRGLHAEAVGAVSHDRLARAGTWAPVVAVATGVPTVDLDGRERLGTIARATAGFRDEFYALVPFVDDAAGVTDDDAPVPPVVPAGHARLVTAGLVEPARVLWGQRATRFAGRRLLAPVVDVARLRRRSGEPDGNRQLAVWADARLRPKVVVAAQTRTVEAAVDDDGSWWPSVPVISVTLDPERDSSEERWLVAAALMAPPVAAWAAERTAGTALAAHALKIPARQIVEVPLPVDRDAWREGAQLLKRVASAPDEAERAAVLAAAGRALTAAHALPVSTAADVLHWWAERAGCSDQL
jgi:hypothetical protein